MRKATRAYQEQSELTKHSSLENFIPLVRRIANQMHGKLPDQVEIGDLVQAGCEGLMQAWHRWDSAGGASFETFAGTRIRGAILDYLRQEDMLPKRERTQLKKIESAINRLRNELGHEPNEEQLALHLNMPLSDLQEYMNISATQVLSLDDLGWEDPADYVAALHDHQNPMDQAAFRQNMDRLADKLKTLSTQEQTILSLYHEEDLTFKEISSIVSLSEARVCQIYGQAVIRLKSFFAPKP